MASKNKNEKAAEGREKFRQRKARMTAQREAAQCEAAPYTIEDLVDDKNRSLYEEVNNKRPVVLVADPGLWGVGTNKNDPTLYICCCLCDDPRAAFVHELLHGKYDPDYPLPIFNNGDVLSDAYVNDIMQYLHNNLLHWKFYLEFKQLGYLATSFVMDMNEGVKSIQAKLPAVEKQFSLPHQTLPPDQKLDLARLYLMTRNPQEADFETGMRPYTARIEAMAPVLVQGIKSLLDDWATEKEKDMRYLMARFFKAAGYEKISFGGGPNSVHASRVEL